MHKATEEKQAQTHTAIRSQKLSRDLDAGDLVTPR